MKISIMRSSGKPIKQADIDSMDRELKNAFEDVEKVLGKPTPDNMEQFQSSIYEAVNDIEGKYPMVSTISYPNTRAKLEKLIEEFGSVAFCFEDSPKDGQVLVCYILDK